MPDLETSLHFSDLGFLKIIAEHWGIELRAPDAPTALQRLIPLMLDAELLLEIYEALPPQAQQALQMLQQKQGRIPWTQFVRHFGELRDVGPGKRDRVRPDRNPISVTEILWYRGLIRRDFMPGPETPVEYAYLPDEWLILLPSTEAEIISAPGRSATPAERAHILPINDWILDDACTYLAWLRNEKITQELTTQREKHHFKWFIRVHHVPALRAFLIAAGLIDENENLNAEEIKKFLEAPRGDALARLVQSWLYAQECNDLCLVPNLICEGEWVNDPLRTRQAVIKLLEALPETDWWNLVSFQAAVRSRHPDYQRSSGEYDSWYIRDARTGEYLRGFENWDAVDGALIHYLITGPFYWLGLLELASPSENAPVTAFRRSRWWKPLSAGEVPADLPDENESFLISSDARLRLPRLVPRSARYQVARFANWDDAAPDGYRYHITPVSLDRARRQGLGINHLITILRKFALTVPPSLVRALERWNERGSEASIKQLVVLQVSSPDILLALRKSKAARFLGDPLGPTAVIVRSNAAQKVLYALAELGYLGEATLSETERTDKPAEIL
jgi:hypothetical protein